MRIELYNIVYSKHFSQSINIVTNKNKSYMINTFLETAKLRSKNKHLDIDNPMITVFKTELLSKKKK